MRKEIIAVFAVCPAKEKTMKNFTKGLIAVLLVLIVGMSAVFAGETKLVEFKPTKYRNGEKFYVCYDNFLKNFFILEDSPFEGARRLFMDDSMTEMFVLNVKKAAAWRQIAIDNNAEIKKELPNSAFSATYKVIYNLSGRVITEKGLAYIFMNFSYRNKTAEFEIYCPKYDISGSSINNAAAFQRLYFKNDDINKFADSLDWDTLYKQERKLLGLPVEGDDVDLGAGFDGTSSEGTTTNTAKQTFDSLFQ